MDTEELKNGTALTTPQLPAVDPEVIRQAQHLLNLVQAGTLRGFVAVGLGGDGNTSQHVALPQTLGVLQLIVGGLQALISDIVDQIKHMRQRVNVPRILKPPMMGRHG